MLDVALDEVSFAVRRSPLAVRDVTLLFARSTTTAIVGPPASGISTLLRLLAGDLRPDSGTIRIGNRDVTKLRRARRPLLYVTPAIEASPRWSVRHLLVAAVRQRSLDRVDRQREFELAAAKWRLETILDQQLRTLSTTERTLVHAARIELLKPAILIADRVLDTSGISDSFYRTMRVLGTTVICAPSSTVELGLSDRVIVLDQGRVVQDGVPSQVYRQPVSEAAARATGEVNVIPIVIRGSSVESVIGTWEVPSPSFQGSGIALARPEQFEIAPPGQESDLIFGIEEASFRGDHWQATGVLSGAFSLRVALPGAISLHKGRLLALRFDPHRFTLLPR